MSKQSIVRLVAHAAVNVLDWEQFMTMVAETKQIVASEGDSVITHECYFDSESFQCIIVEAYVSEKAFLIHLDLIKPLSEKYKIDWKITRLELLGQYAAEIVKALKQGVPELAHYAKVL